MKYFIAGPGNVTLFNQDGSIALTSVTLVDSSLGFQVTLEEIRAGLGAKLYGKYAHTTGMTMKLTDAMWNLKFLAANVGSSIIPNEGSALASVTKTVGAGGAISIADIVPKKLFTEDDKTYVWYSKVGSDVWTSIPYNEGDTSISSSFAENDSVCVKYVQENGANQTIKVSSAFIPSTFTAVLEATLFSGDVNSNSGTVAGKISITMPRFMLNGTMDMAMTMTGASQMAIEGSALAVESADCAAGTGYYATITQLIIDEKWYSSLSEIFVEDSEGYTAEADSSFALADVIVHGGFNDSTIMKRLATTQYKFSEVSNSTGFAVATGGAAITIAETVQADDVTYVTVVPVLEGTDTSTASDTFKITIVAGA